MKGWRTIIFGGLISTLGVLQSADLITLFGDKRMAGWAMAGIGIATIWLRLLTTTPAGGK